MLPSKWENLSRCSTKLIRVCKKLPLALDYGQNYGIILSKYIIYIFFNFGCGFYGYFSTLFRKSQASCCKKLLKQFLLHCTSVFVRSKSMSQIFKILFQTRDIKIFVLRGIFFSRYVQLKSFFSDEKNISGEIWDTL